jgi:hypothetical protein
VAIVTGPTTTAAIQNVATIAAAMTICIYYVSLGVAAIYNFLLL